MTDETMPPCRICGGVARHASTKLCDRCWELESRIHADRELAQRIVADLVLEAPAGWPAHFPGAWQHWPQSLRDVSAVVLLRYWLETFGPADLVKQLTTSEFGQTALRRLAEVPPQPSRTAGADEWWPLFLLVARAQHALSHPIPSPE